ncbi:Resact receptor [Araneus ventricosus]|uniref:Resact receptor n=1 Tax=Araneus ventricosus TaxID=182803 RepID=A0A4Y2G8R5_ARAVE|nr:Resact receptor [Araneus ventricosus]
MFPNFFRHYRYEHKLACLLWKVEIKDVSCFPSENDGEYQQFKNFQESDKERETSGPKVEDSVTGRIKSTIGVYKGNTVYIYHVYKKSIDLTRGLRKEMIQIREMRHENINPFIGACVDPPNICILTLFCARGSLQVGITAILTSINLLPLLITV